MWAVLTVEERARICSEMRRARLFQEETEVKMRPRLLLALLCAFLAACANSHTAVHEGVEAPEVLPSWEDGCEDERTVVLLCSEDSDECGFFLCRDVVPREVLLASRGGGAFNLPMGRPSARRWRNGRAWSAEPILTFRFNRHFDPKPPLLALPPGRYVRHHIFSQASDLRAWFHGQGIPNIHQFTMVIPEYLHIRIHSGGPSGGLWNEAWRRFQKQNPNATPEEIYRHAGELIFRFELTGPIVPYYRGR